MVPFKQECWLFPQPGFTKPWTHESFNKEWHGIRDATADLAVDESAAEHGWVEWPASIPYMNCRHHAAMWLYGLTKDWADVARTLGHTVKTLQERYVRAADDADDRIRQAYDQM